MLPAGQRVAGQPVLDRLHFLEKAQWWDRNRIEVYRDAQLSQLCYTAYHDVPFYRDLFDQAGLHWHDIRRPEDLTRLPAVTKQMLRGEGRSRITRRTGFPVREESSSGSTGTPFYVLEDAETACRRRAAFLLALEWAGWNFGDAHLQTGVMESRTGERRWKDLLLRCHYLSALDLGDRKLDAALARMDRHGVRHLWGYPCALYRLALRAAALGWNRPMRSVVTWGDMLDSTCRRKIEAVFGRRVFDTYGCSEGIQVSAQCGSGSHYHVHSFDTIVEIVNEQGYPVRSGETGRVLLTRLQAGAMPMIRYDVGDMAVAGDSAICACGRELHTMGAIEGRQTDFVETPSGKRLMVHFFALVLEHFPAIEQYRVVQRDADSLEIQCVFDRRSRGALAAIKKGIHTQFREYGLDDMRIELADVPRIDVPSNGKHRFVVNERHPAGVEGAVHEWQD
ncbi:MAG: hypothetical protein U0Q16_18595 [Bryobacteraceae bacterium]